MTSRSRSSPGSSTRRPLISELVALDRRAAPIVDQLCDHLVDAESAFLRAEELGTRLELTHLVQRQIERPTRDSLALLVRVAVTLDRKAARRHLKNDWLGGEPEPAWSHRDRAGYDKAVSKLETQS